MYRWLPKANAQATVHKVLQPAIRFEKDQCLDLPDVTFVERDAPLTPQQMKYYKLLKKQMTMSADGEQVTSVNAATNINKLLQISGGAVYTDNREVIEFDVSNRLRVIQEVIEEASHKVLQPAIRFEKNQCLDLPDVTFVERDAPLTPQQNKYYKLLKKQMIMSADGEQVTSVNAATNINKLLQISGGAVYTDTKEVIEFDVSNRLRVIQEVIEEASHKVLVFVPFTHTIELLSDYLTRAGITCDVINGQVPVNKRHDIINDFQSTDAIRVLIIQPQAASHGLTLTAANVVVWYAPVTSVETYLQANARINRPGQKNAMTIVHITGSEVEARLYKMLSSNIDNHTKIIDLYRQEIITE